MRVGGVVLIGLMTVASVCGAQASAARCTPRDTALDTTAEWYRRQQAWLSETAGGTSATWTNGSLRSLLLAAAPLDTTRALPVQLGGAQIVDGPEHISSNTQALGAGIAQLRQLARDRQSPWPTRSVVGPAGFRAAWLIARTDTALLRTALHRMMEAGPEESLAADVAVLEDRVRVLSGRKQLYGTQLRRVGATFVVAPLEDSAHVDMRRDAAGLPPLRVALCTAATSIR